MKIRANEGDEKELVHLPVCQVAMDCITFCPFHNSLQLFLMPIALTFHNFKNKMHKMKHYSVFINFLPFFTKNIARRVCFKGCLIFICIQLISYKRYLDRSVHSFNGDYLSIPECTGSCGNLFHEIPSIKKD